MQPGSEGSADKPRIVIIDDDPELLLVIAAALETLPAEVEAHQDALAGVAAVRARTPHLVVTDLTMPVITGQEVIERIRRDHPGAYPPIMVLSGVGQEEVMLECFSLGATDYLTKPINPPELRAKAAVLLARAGAARVAERTAAPAFDPSDLPPGARFGDYTIVRKLGAGGMGTVYAAESAHRGLVAIKVLSTELSKDRVLLRRFLREAAHLKAIRHPNVVAFYDMGHEAGAYFLAMELAPGQPLDAFAKGRLPLSEADALRVAGEVTSALEALDLSRIVHRDLKPANVIVNGDWTRLKLVDFGLTRRPHEQRLTDTDVLMGTPHFIAPEQITSSQTADIRSDLYALGVLLFWMLTGRYPFEGETPFAILQGHACTPAPAVRTYNPTVSEEAQRMVARLLQKNPSHRYQSPTELLDELWPQRRGDDRIAAPLGAHAAS